MIDRLVERGYLQGSLSEAFARVDRRRFLPEAFRTYARVDVPLPLGAEWPGRAGYSPRGAAVLLLALDVQPGHRVLIDAPDGGYLAALAAELAGPRGQVLLATGSARGAALASRRLKAAGYHPERARAVAESPYDRAAWDRVLVAEEAAAVPTPARHALAELGALVVRVPRAERMEIIRTVRAGTDFADILVGDLAAASRPLGAGVEESWPIRRILALEEAIRRVWTGDAGSQEEAEFSRAVGETWRPRRKALPTDLEAARSFFHSGYVYLMAGDLETAEDAFRASLVAVPSAEAFTFLGWTWSFSGRFEEAIEACRRAIGVDPRFGNAYNDIGAYLIELGRPDEALPWLERAMRAPRYAARAYPYANLARARLMIGDVDGARRALHDALQVDPEYEPARELLRRLSGEADEETDDGELGTA